MSRRRVLLDTKVQLFILVLSLTIFLASASPKALASPQVRIYLEPSNYVFDMNNATLGMRFNVTVWVGSDAPFKLAMWQVLLTWDDNLINVTRVWGNVTEDWTYRVWPNDNFGGTSWDPQYVFYGKVTDIGGPYYYNRTNNLVPGKAAIVIGDSAWSDVNVTESKKLCAIEFEIKKLPEEGQTLTCALSINYEDSTYLYNWEGPIPYTVERIDGTYIFIPEFPMFIISIILLSSSIGVAVAKKLRKLHSKHIH